MQVLAAILDPSDNGFDIGDLSLLVGVIVAISALTATFVRWLAKRREAGATAERVAMERRIKEAISIATKPIAPEYRNNGGSLRDVADKIDVVIERQSHIADRLDKHIDWHMERES